MNESRGPSVLGLASIEPLESRIALSRAELTRAFELVYRNYIASRFIPANDAELVYQRAFGLSSSRTILTCHPEQLGGVEGTLTVVGDNPLGLNIELTYPGEVEDLRGAGRRLAEVTCLAIAAERRSRNASVFFSLTQFMFQYACWRGYDDLLLAVHPRHVPFYERCFRVSQLGPCRPHKLVRDNPAIACRIDLHVVCEQVVDEFREWYVDRQLPASEFVRPAISHTDHRHFCDLIGLSLATDQNDHRRAA